MSYSQENLEKIEKLASLYMSITDISVILDMPVNKLRSDISQPGTEVRAAYMRGKASTKLELRKQEMMLARVGSPLALDNFRKSLMDMEDDE